MMNAECGMRNDNKWEAMDDGHRFSKYTESHGAAGEEGA